MDLLGFSITQSSHSTLPDRSSLVHFENVGWDGNVISVAFEPLRLSPLENWANLVSLVHRSHSQSIQIFSKQRLFTVHLQCDTRTRLARTPRLPGAVESRPLTDEDDRRASFTAVQHYSRQCRLYAHPNHRARSCVAPDRVRPSLVLCRLALLQNLGLVEGYRARSSRRRERQQALSEETICQDVARLGGKGGRQASHAIRPTCRDASPSTVHRVKSKLQPDLLAAITIERASP